MGDDSRAIYRPSLLSQIFSHSFDEIADKRWLRQDVENVVNGMVKRVDSLAPFSFLLRFAPLHSIKEAWKKSDAHPATDNSPALNSAKGSRLSKNL